jgi:hypothetical protein
MNQIKGWPLWAIGLFAATSLSGNEWNESAVIDLEAFIVEETAQTQQETVSPLSMRVDSLFGQDSSVWEIPRAYTVLSPQQLELLQIDSYDTLDRAGAGTQRINYFGLAGSAFLRGAKAGTYFNGMLRAYQRNEMPMSFGSLDGLEIIKGPVPASFMPTLVGGAVNQRPKAPFFDRRRGSVEIQVGSWDAVELSFDYGQPFLLGNRPAAYRFSYTGNRADRYFESVDEAFESYYAALKVKFSERNRLSVAAEYYDFRSSEIPGINRPTPELIASGSYVIGEPPLLTSPAWGGNAVRPLLEFPYTLVVNPSLHALAIPGESARAAFSPDLLDTLLDLNDPEVVAELYQIRPASQVPPFAAWAIEGATALLAEVEQVTQDAYVYTPEFFAAGGEALTVALPMNKVLSDRLDRADSSNALLAVDLETRLQGGGRLMSRLYGEYLSTDKLSTYGFAMQTEQRILHGRVEWSWDTANSATAFSLGADVRYAWAEMIQDFDAEPFSRRDLSMAGISANTVVRTGGQRGPDGLNYWSSFGNASQRSKSLQTDLFAGGAFQVSPVVVVHYGTRAGFNFWETGLPRAVERASESQFVDRADKHDTFLWQAHLNPVLRLHPSLNAFATFQKGKALAPGDGGTISGKETFTDVSLYELGLKWRLGEDRLFASISAYQWDQATFSNRDAAARPLEGRGVEAELYFAASDAFAFLASATVQRVTVETELLDFGAIPQSEEGWALNGGILNAAGGRSAPLNPDNVLAGLPEKSAQLHLVWTPGEHWRLGVGPLWRDAFYHDMQRAMRIPSSVLWNATLKWERRNFWIQLDIENLFDAFYWVGQEPIFSAGTLILQGTPRKWQLSTGFSF